MTSKYYISCPQCVENIGKIDTKAARLWMDLCALNLKIDDILLFDYCSPTVSLLENHGYIVTTETDKFKILLKLKGNFYERTSNDVFCVKGCSYD